VTRDSDNELTRYQYGIILEVGHTAAVVAERRFNWEVKGPPVIKPFAQIKQDWPPSVHVCEIGNARLHKDLAIEKPITTVDTSRSPRKFGNR